MDESNENLERIWAMILASEEVDDESHIDKREADEAHHERERASGNKLWSIYISEAESYDKGLIEGWRSEMDGLLIFAGLFSGVITTFIIDSYKTLNADPGSQTVVLLSQTVALLSQISNQLANMNNGTAVTNVLPPPTAFSPPVSSLICNALWFASLGLSLSSALVATLVKQWAQEYQHRTSMFSSPSVRARVYMYLYYGLRRFNMHAVVGIPPLLLHGALVLFFAGLVAFLVPINVIIMGICSALLLVFVLVYVTFTTLPLLFFDCPYQTPLTRILWSLNQSLGRVLRVYICRAVAACKTFLQEKIAVTDPENGAGSALTNPDASAEPSAPADTLLQSQSMVDALKAASLYPPVETETRTLAWAVQSLSDDDELEKLVEGLPQTLWDFDKNKPRSVYQALFLSLLRDPEVHLGQRLADFMAGSNSNLLEHKDRLRRQLSVLRAIWAICAFSLHTGSPLQSPIGEADVHGALLSSKFLNSDEVQSMVHAVSALIRLNMIESRSQERALTQPSDSDSNIRTEAEKEWQAEKHRTYTQYLVAFSTCAASFQRDATNSLFHQSQILFTEADDFWTVHHALDELIEYTSNKTADNLVFAARQIITPFAQTSEYPNWPLWGLAPFLLRHPSLAASEGRPNSQPGSKHHYTRFLCHKLCDNLGRRSNPRPSVDALELIYGHLLDSPVPPRDFDTHLRVLRTLRTEAADIRTHRLAAIVQCVILKTFSSDLSEWGKSWESADLSEWEGLLSIFDDEDWFRSVLGLNNDEQTERASAQQIYGCTCVGVYSTFFKQCTARSPDQLERELDCETLKSVPYAVDDIRSVIPTEIQRRFADTVSGFIRKYPKDCLAGGTELFRVLVWAVKKHNGWIKDLDALHVLCTAVSEVQTDHKQQSHRDRAEWIRGYMQARLLLETRIRERTQERLLPENIPAESVPLACVSE
ncbi:unnamed protein product [Mycena citricolor]|uniref:DUF6535 domain-containing protein n=1 Tax=Mycena citricolor TaxID=2018698 RepID=A0AAD2K5K9_9AGAR|nr:unnamed protein product [Mycena citricolor]